MLRVFETMGLPIEKTSVEASWGLRMRLRGGPGV